MAGQVKHASLFSSLKPDWRLLQAAGVAAGEEHRRADRRRAARVLEEEGIRLADSTLLLKPLLAGEGR